MSWHFNHSPIAPVCMSGVCERVDKPSAKQAVNPAYNVFYQLTRTKRA